MILNVVIFFKMSDQVVNVNSFWVPHTPIPLLIPNDSHPLAGKELSYIRPHVPEPVDNHVLVLKSFIQLIFSSNVREFLALQQAFNTVVHTASSSLFFVLYPPFHVGLP